MTVPTLPEVLLSAVAMAAYSNMPAFDNKKSMSFEQIHSGLKHKKFAKNSSMRFLHDRIAARWSHPSVEGIADPYDRFNAIVAQDELAIEAIHDLSHATGLLVRVSHESLSYLNDVVSVITEKVDKAIAQETLSNPVERTWEGLGVELSTACDAILISDAWSRVSSDMAGEARADLEIIDYTRVRSDAYAVPKVRLSDEETTYLTKRLMDSDLNIDPRSFIALTVDPSSRAGLFLDAPFLSDYQNFAALDARCKRLSRIAEKIEHFFDHLPEDDQLRDGEYHRVARGGALIVSYLVVYLNKIFCTTRYKDVVIFTYDREFYYYNVLHTEELENLPPEVINQFLCAQVAHGRVPTNQGYTLADIRAAQNDTKAVLERVGAEFRSQSARDIADKAEAIIGREISAAVPAGSLTGTVSELKRRCEQNPRELADNLLHLLVTVANQPALMEYYTRTKEAAASTESIEDAVGQGAFNSIVGTLLSDRALIAA